MGIGGQPPTLRDVKIKLMTRRVFHRLLAYVNPALTTFQTFSWMHMLCYRLQFCMWIFNPFFSVCCFSSLFFVTGFFFIEADLENDGIGEIMVNGITRSFRSYLDIFFVSGLEFVWLEKKTLPMFSNKQPQLRGREKYCIISQRHNVEGLRRAACLNLRQKSPKSSSSGWY